MKTLILITLLIASAPAFAATAYFTGHQRQVQTVTYQWAWECEYRYGGQTFTRVFANSCPNQIEVQ